MKNQDEDYAYEMARQRRVDDGPINKIKLGATHQAPHRPQVFHRTDPHKNVPFSLKDLATQEMDAFEKCVGVVCVVVALMLVILGVGSM